MGIYLVLKNNLKRSMNHRMLFGLSFFLPVILCCLFGLVRFDKVSLRIGILEAQDEKNGWTNQEELYPLLEQSEGVSYAVADEESSNTDLMMGRFHVLLDYRRAVSLREIPVISYQSEERQQLLQEALQRMIEDKRPLNLTGLHEYGLSITERSLTMVLSLFMIFATIHASAFIRDRESGVMIRYEYTGYRKSEYLMGYFFHTLLITLIQVLLCITLLSLLQPGFSLTIKVALILTLVIAAMSSIYGVAICAFSKSEVVANVTASSLAGCFAILGGTFVAVEAMPGLLRILSFASPMRWIVELLQRM